MLTFTCPHCGESLEVGRPAPGERMPCSRCGQWVSCPPTMPEGDPFLVTIITPPPQMPAVPVPASGESIEFLGPPQEPGELGRLGAYRVLKVLGAGGMGIVFHAEDVHLRRPVALKCLLPALAATAQARQR